MAPNTLIELEPAEVAELLATDKILLVDVREPYEFDAGHIENAVLFPMSIFDPADLPDPEGRMIVFQCATGIRSANAARASMAAGLPHQRHLRGGIRSWVMAGLPAVRD